MLMKQEENRPMDKLKSDYESIPVPTEAKERMLAGIAQAKKEQKGVIIMKFAKNRRGRCRCHDCHYRAGQRHLALANAMEQIPVIDPLQRW